MRSQASSDARSGTGLRRALAAAGGVLLLLCSVGTAGASGPALAPLAGPRATGGTAVTVPGPPVWQPSTGTYGARGTVTATPVHDLGDQVVHVSWTGFTPSTTHGPSAPTSVHQFDSNVSYPVRVYECRGADPKVTDCYGSTHYGQDPAKGFQQAAPAAGTSAPEFPSDMAIAVTHPDGTGAADIEVWTSHESQSLGCDTTHTCSIVVEPNYGGDAINFLGGCSDHSLDDNFEATDSITTFQDAQNNNFDGESCAWNNHAVIPLSFAPTADDCHGGSAQFKAAGLAMFNRAMQQWRAGFCQGAGALNLQYDFGVSEDEARNGFLGGTGTDVAMVGLPAASGAAHEHAYTYAPLANSGISVVFKVDDPVTGTQLTTMDLDARLLAKMLTQSYVQALGASFPTVTGNPQCVFDDPEFKKLNPVDPAWHAAWPTCGSLSGTVAALSPVVLGGNSDLIHQLTAWIAADPDAHDFLAGKPDPWGMHVNTSYEAPAFAGYPVNSLVPQDSSEIPAQGNQPAKPWKGLEWNPVQGGLDQVLRDMVDNQPTCLSTDLNASGTHDKCARQTNGARAMFGIVDTGEAQALALPEAALNNAAGTYVKPTAAGMTAAVRDMPAAASTGVQLLPYGRAHTSYSTDRTAYPLTMVQYAMVPTSGEPKAKATAISGFVTRATAPAQGQHPGLQPGRTRRRIRGVDRGPAGPGEHRGASRGTPGRCHRQQPAAREWLGRRRRSRRRQRPERRRLPGRSRRAVQFPGPRRLGQAAPPPPVASGRSSADLGA